MYEEECDDPIKNAMGISGPEQARQMYEEECDDPIKNAMGISGPEQAKKPSLWKALAS